MSASNSYIVISAEKSQANLHVGEQAVLTTPNRYHVSQSR